MKIFEIFDKIDFFLWNTILIYLLLLVGIYLTIKLKGMQIRYLFPSLKLAFSRQDKKAQGDISQFQSLMTALAATIGIGSIAGMATAVISGGFGAIFWMWVVALIGMVTKYAEAVLAVKYRIVDKRKQNGWWSYVLYSKRIEYEMAGYVICDIWYLSFLWWW